MKFVQLGDRKVSAIGLGVWQFGTPHWGMDLDEAAARPIVQRALDVGINLFDTAEVYGHGRSEQILASAFAGRRDEAFLASKVLPTHFLPSQVVSAAKNSLERLQTGSLDLYQAHFPNRLLPVSWTMKGMRDLLDAGLIKQVGVSNFSLGLWQRAERSLGRAVVSNQVQFHLLDRSPMYDLLPFAQKNGRAIIAYSPLAQGVLGGRYNAGNLPSDFRSLNPLFSRDSFARIMPLLNHMQDVGRRHGATVAQIALAWLIHLPNVIAIPGARSVEQVEANAAAYDIDLTEDEWRGLEAVATAVQPVRTRRRLTRLSALLLGARI